MASLSVNSNQQVGSYGAKQMNSTNALPMRGVEDMPLYLEQMKGLPSSLN